MMDRLRRLRDRVRGLEDGDRPASALLAVREILRHRPDDANALLLQGRLLTSLARYGEAEGSLHEALIHFAEESAYVVHRELGHLYEGWGRFEMALAEFEKVIALQPEHASGYIYSGAILAKLGRFEEAAARHTTASRCAEGRTEEAHLNLGLVLRAQERFEEARACFERALAIDPAYAEARAALSDVTTALQSPLDDSEQR